MADLSRGTSFGTCSYNGFTFPDNVRTTKFVGKPVPDATGRTTAYIEYTIALTCRLAGNTTSAKCKDARTRLSMPGGALIYKNRDMGDFEVNTADYSGAESTSQGAQAAGLRDVAWGPKPGDLETLPIGGGYNNKDGFIPGLGAAVRLSWSVTFRLPDCDNARNRFAPLEFSYDVDYDIDQSGYTVRTISGFIRIAMTLLGAGIKKLPDSADRYREQICPRFVEGFRRKTNKFKINNARDRLDFSVTDEELKGPAPPPGIIDYKFTQNAGNEGSMNFAKWASTIACEYEMAKGVGVDVALGHFAQLIDDRIVASKGLAVAADQTGRTKKFADAQKKTGSFLLPVKFTADRATSSSAPTTARFSLQYIYFMGGSGRGSYQNALLASGMWRPITGTDWAEWAGSMAGIVGPRGVANLAFRVSDDKIVDLCSPDLIVAGKAASFLSDDAIALLDKLDIGTPSKENSWLEFTQWWEVESDSGNATYRDLSETDSSSTSGGSDGSAELRSVEAGTATSGPPDATGSAESLSKATTPTMVPDAVPGKDGESTTVSVSPPLIVAYLVGMAFRAGFKIPLPEVKDLKGGVQPVLSNRLDANPKEGFSTGMATNFGIPVYWAAWRQRYIIPRMDDGSLPELVNPILDRK